MEPDPNVTNPPDNAPQVIASLTYDDVDAAVDWLTRVFGFVERPHTRVTHEGVSYHAELDLPPKGLVYLGPPFSDRASPATRGGTTTMLVAYVLDIQAHHDHAVAEGATIIAGIEDTFYGDLTYRASDVEGHHWMFAQRVRDVAPEDWDWSPEG